VIKRQTNLRVKQNISRRELDVLRGLCLGKTSTEVAEDLGISSHTVVMHRKRLMLKIGARNSSHLIFMAYRLGLFKKMELE